MENKVDKLKEMGYDISVIIERSSQLNLNSGIDNSWTEENITRFSERIYQIVLKGENHNYGKKRTIKKRI